MQGNSLNLHTPLTSDVLIMERAHRFCIKYMQGLRRRTRTDIDLSMIAIYSIDSEINFKKRIFEQSILLYYKWH